MSDASDKLARTRLAILEHLHRKEHGYEKPPRRSEGAPPMSEFDPPSGGPRREEPLSYGSGWLGHARHAVRTWWRYHPAQMAVEMVTPMAQSYARKHPVQLVVAAAAAGAVLMVVRPWRLVSITTLVVAILKSSQVSSLVLSAMSAANYEKDNQRPGGGY